MIAGTHNFTIDQGATFSRRISVKNSDDSVYSLVGYAARMQIRRDQRSSNPMIALSTENGALTIYPTDGEISIYLTDEQTATLSSDGVYDLELLSPSGEVFRLLQGKVRLRPEVTR